MNDEFNKAVSAYQSGRLDEAFRLAAPINAPEAQHLAGLSLAGLGQLDDAIVRFERAAETHPQPVNVLVDFASVMRRARRLEDAVSIYQRALAATPSSSKALNGLAIAQIELERYADAEAALTKLIALEPGNAGALNNLGILLLRQKRHQDAFDAFTKALSIKPNLASACANRGNALRGLNRLEEAEADGRKAVGLAPASQDAHYQLANTLRVRGEVDAAAGAYRTALSLDPARSDIHGDLARMLWEAGQLESAFADLDQAIAATGSSELALLRGTFAFRAGDMSRAELEAGRIPEGPCKAHAFSLQGRVARQRNDRERALAALRASAALAPDDFELLHHCCEAELAFGAYEAAAQRLDRAAPKEHLQRHIGLKALAMRAGGDPTYSRYYDYDRLVRAIDIEAPDGFDSVDAFNAALATAIKRLHSSKVQPIDQTLFGGTQSFGSLWGEGDPAIKTFAKTMMSLARRYADRLPFERDHPFLGASRGKLAEAGSWSVILASGGGHVDHIHPEGWVSAVYYVQTPADLGGADKAGYLRLGASGVSGLALPAEHWVEPKPGRVVFFPSYIWHGVETFSSAEERIAAPFDLAITG